MDYLRVALSSLWALAGTWWAWLWMIVAIVAAFVLKHPLWHVVGWIMLAIAFIAFVIIVLVNKPLDETD